MKWIPPVSCEGCDRPIRKYMIGGEIPCYDCGGVFCEKCCDQKKDAAKSSRGKT